ncbi:MAG: asparagine synthase C-terminal domain-containing protein, partial [Bacteroidota bacterium]
FMSDTANEISPHKSIEKLNPVEWMMAMDTETYLRGDILVKVDRASMSTSLETRAPFLDARVVRAGWSLPFDAKVKDGRGKIALREILAKHVPLELTDRSKQGFAIPIDRWLRGSLRCWAEELLRKQDLCILSGLNESAVSNLWLKHQAEKENHGQTLWTILMLFAWLDSHYSCELALNSGKPSSKLLHAV